jgi:hypothetical protein
LSRFTESSIDDGSTLTAECEAALGSPARPLDADRVLTKIRELSTRDAPGLEPSVVSLRADIEADRWPSLTCREWMAGFFA